MAKKNYPLYETTVFRDFRVMVENVADKYPDRPAVRFKKNPRKPEVTEITVDYPNLNASTAGAAAVSDKFAYELRAVPPGSQSIDCMVKEAFKSTGIKRLIGLLGVSPTAVYTTGDSPNDLDMLTYPEFEGYAVENALPVVKDTVGRVVADPLTLLTRLLSEPDEPEAEK